MENAKRMSSASTAARRHHISYRRGALARNRHVQVFAVEGLARNHHAHLVGGLFAPVDGLGGMVGLAGLGVSVIVNGLDLRADSHGKRNGLAVGVVLLQDQKPDRRSLHAVSVAWTTTRCQK